MTEEEVKKFAIEKLGLVEPMKPVEEEQPKPVEDPENNPVGLTEADVQRLIKEAMQHNAIVNDDIDTPDEKPVTAQEVLNKLMK